MEFINGVTLLSGATNCIPLPITLGCGILFLACIAALFILLDKNGMVCFILSIVATIAFIVCLSGIIVGSKPTYKVTINDSVSMNEFVQKYNIESQDGLIYTITIK